jgi:16S rRNA (guanine966-N2)-methyltransferase
VDGIACVFGASAPIADVLPARATVRMVREISMADAGRVIAGSARGVRLRAPGPGTRPLADRVKQTLFAILEPDLPGAHVLDLFAGSGAGGIEALSRGAASAIFVEKDQGAAAVIDTNLRATGLAGPAATVIRWDVVRWLAEPNVDAAFDLVLVDPPYAETELLTRVLTILGEPVAPIRPGARVVAKHFWRDRPPAAVGRLTAERDRRFGETALTFYRRADSVEDG